jgi:hypothetical protein
MRPTITVLTLLALPACSGTKLCPATAVPAVSVEIQHGAAPGVTDGGYGVCAFSAHFHFRAAGGISAVEQHLPCFVAEGDNCHCPGAWEAEGPFQVDLFRADALVWHQELVSPHDDCHVKTQYVSLDGAELTQPLDPSGP